MKVSVLGLGYIGLPTAIILAKNGNCVRGFDVNEDVISILNSGNIHITEKGLQEEYKKVVDDKKLTISNQLIESDAYIIAVPTPFVNGSNPKIADLTYIEEAVNKISKVLKKGDLVILESTVPPNTTRYMTELLCKESGLNKQDIFTVHCPERVLPGNILFELENNDRIIGSDNQNAANLAKKLYETFLVNGVIYITDDVTAEMCKIVENSFRDVNIAFANELSIICDQLNIDVNKLIQLANKHPRVQILNPGVGVGGHCIAVDPYFLIQTDYNNTKLIKTAREVNNDKPKFIAEKIKSLVEYDRTKKIGILGLSFKANIDDIRESPSLILCELLKNDGYYVVGCEPHVNQKSINGIENIDFLEVLDIVDLVVLTQKHDFFTENLNLILSKTCYIV